MVYRMSLFVTCFGLRPAMTFPKYRYLTCGAADDDAAVGRLLALGDGVLDAAVCALGHILGDAPRNIFHKMLLGASAFFKPQVLYEVSKLRKMKVELQHAHSVVTSQ